MRRFLIAGLLALTTASVAVAQELTWKETTVSGLVAVDDDYYYNIKTTLGSISGTMFTVTHMTKDKAGEGIMAFCTAYANLGRMGDTLMIERREWSVYMGASEFKRKQVADSLKKGTVNDFAFAMSYACLDSQKMAAGERQTLYIPSGATYTLPYPTSDLKMNFAATPDGRIATKIVR